MNENRICFVFIDGWGLAPSGPDNPFSAGWMAGLEARLGARLVAGLDLASETRLARELDARLGVPGLPQSATGQTALLTGKNASKLVGRHQPAFPGKILTEVLRSDNLLKRVHQAGGRVSFANAYSEIYFDELRAGDRSPSVTTLAVEAAGFPYRMLDQLLSGEGLYWDITRRMAQKRPEGKEIPAIEPEEAAKHLASLAQKLDLVLFESFMTDILGHRGRLDEAQAFLKILDRFLSKLCDLITDDGGSLLITSDHGNIEDLSTRAHTLNPVPLIVFGPAAKTLSSARSIMDIHDLILAHLGIESS